MTNKTSDYDLTVIVPVYNERGNMLRLETALSAFLKKSKVKSCILFVKFAGGIKIFFISVWLKTVD